MWLGLENTWVGHIMERLQYKYLATRTLLRFHLKNTSSLLQIRPVSTLLQSFRVAKTEKFGNTAGPILVWKLRGCISVWRKLVTHNHLLIGSFWSRWSLYWIIRLLSHDSFQKKTTEISLAYQYRMWHGSLITTVADPVVFANSFTMIQLVTHAYIIQAICNNSHAQHISTCLHWQARAYVCEWLRDMGFQVCVFHRKKSSLSAVFLSSMLLCMVQI